MLHVQTDLLVPGVLTVSSPTAQALTTGLQRILESLQNTDAVLSVYALHPSEQDGTAQAAYANERLVTGPSGVVAGIVELPRPREKGVVWIDRYHLLVSGIPLRFGAQLFGLYVGSQGRMIAYVHSPEMLHPFAQQLRLLAEHPRRWEEPFVAGACLLAVRYDDDQRDALDMRMPSEFVPATVRMLSDLGNQW